MVTVSAEAGSASMVAVSVGSGVVALDEVVIHGWDLAVATGQPFTVDPDLLPAVHGFVEATAAPEMADAREGLFGRVVEVDDDASPLDRVLGLAGRDPRWSPPG